MIFSTGRIRVLCATTAFYGLAISAVTAQQTPAQSTLLEEIIVTSQKRQERLQDTPLSVTAFSGAAIKELGLTTSTDLAQQTPGLKIGTPVGEGNNPSITLRGVGLNDFNDNNESPVAVYIDDVYMGSLAGQTFQMFDLERVEVLRGPQGTLYGRNSTGGLINFISKRPTKEMDVYLEGSYGRHNDVRIETAIGGPLTERLQARASLAYTRADGYVTNRAGPDRNEKENLAYRLQLNADFTDDVSLLLNVHGARSHVKAPVYQHQGTGLDYNGDPCSIGQAQAGQCTDFFGYQDTDGDPFAGAYDRNGRFNLDTKGGFANLTWDFTDKITMTSITSYDEVKKLHEEDTDMSPFDRVDPTFRLKAHQFSEELRLNGDMGSVKWVAGGYYYHQKVNMPQDLRFGVDLDPTFFLQTLAKQKTSSIAGFGQVEWEFVPTLSLLAGLRYTKERKTYDYTQVDVLGSPELSGVPGTVLLDFNQATDGDLAVFDKGIWSGKGGLNWKPNDDILVFASVARGFKSGGFNAGFTSAGPEDIKYNDERLTSYELGLKSTFWDGRARFNVTGFYYDYKNLQALTFRDFSSFITNAANATVKGAEFELVANPLEGLDVNLGLSLIDSKVDGLTGADGETVNNRRLVLAPKTSFNALVRYSVPFENGSSLAAQVDMSYQTSIYFDIFNQPLSRGKGYDIWNGRLTYKFPGEKLELAVWGKNIFNKKYLVYTFDFTEQFGFNQLFYGQPAWYGATLTYRY
ncbi:TonB-dependent receptor [Govanella unica]|uniref:TonB-dependent receptor n=1 Tax=Govanella unica TaxID=2975056 RepID=A0A9X3Z5X7_9PROT|nr:TonB-dependent receptor [Govania unica]MDA5192585.1 TonB-dependent receptor [Govania unica]